MANDSETGAEGDAKSRKIPARTVLTIVILLIAAGIGVFYFANNNPAPYLWDQTSTPYDPTCETDCIDAGHLVGGAHGAPSAELKYNPAVDDPIAQWGDCVQSIFVCLSDNGDPAASPKSKAIMARSCVAASTCPVPCLERFARKASGSPKAVEQALLDIFIGDNAWCLPQEAHK